MTVLAPVCLDGELIAPEEARISVTDEGLLRGDGVFEVVRLYGRRPFALDEHLERMSRSAANLLLPFERAALEEDIQKLLSPGGGGGLAYDDAPHAPREQGENDGPATDGPAAGPDPGRGRGDALLRVLVTRGGRRIAMLESLPQLPESVTLARVTYAPTRVLDGIKSLSYAANMLAGRLARERGFDEALLVTPEGRVLECPTASFFWVRTGELITPPLEDHVLESITRRMIIALTGAREKPTAFEELVAAEEAFIASSVREVLPVRRIEGEDLPAAGPVTSETARAVREEITRRLEGAGAAR